MAIRAGSQGFTDQIENGINAATNKYTNAAQAIDLHNSALKSPEVYGELALSIVTTAYDKAVQARLGLVKIAEAQGELLAATRSKLPGASDQTVRNSLAIAIAQFNRCELDGGRRKIDVLLANDTLVMPKIDDLADLIEAQRASVLRDGTISYSGEMRGKTINAIVPSSVPCSKPAETHPQK